MTGYTMIRKKFKKRSKKKGPVQARKISYDGINFASGLERYMYMALKKAKIQASTKDKHTRYSLALIFLMSLTNDAAMAKVITKIEVLKRY